MNISERLTQEKLLEILTIFYKKGNQKESTLDDLLEEIKQKVLLVINTDK
ncbi:hypothetical protein RCG23_21115 [Neobacillus sp. PS3-34]|nr:hypothetical protein [Neobacillus sp. PS3-34]WML47803.1 hypothetical protein RCG23_21115 [Neobacillus sp. PS3-34]